jgi:hypothetical protein
MVVKLQVTMLRNHQYQRVVKKQKDIIRNKIKNIIKEQKNIIANKLINL